jgi:UDPglucose 6-dehydrogenase
MKIALIGLGKLGYPMSLFLSSKFEVNAYDKNKAVIDNILNKRKKYLENEESLKKYLKKKKRINFFYNLQNCLNNTSACFITVPTPSQKNGSFSNKILRDCFSKIIEIIKKKKTAKPYLINICSTVSPGSCKEEFIKFLEERKISLDKDFVLTYNPYFVALGSVLKNLIKPDYVLIGASSFKAEKIIRKIYNKVYPKSTKILLLKLEEAEIVKIFTNSFLTLKISFGNMIKDLAIKKQLSLKRILNALGSDTRIGKKFLNPGLPFAGPCLPRDNYAVINYLKKTGTSSRLSNEIVNINQISIKSLFKEIDHLSKMKITKIAFLGAGYRPNTQNLDDSISIKIIKYCIKKRLTVSLLDYYTSYSDPRIHNYTNLSKLLSNNEIIFLPFVDNRFKKLINFYHKKFIWDPFYFLNSKTHKIIRNCFEIKNYQR